MKFSFHVLQAEEGTFYWELRDGDSDIVVTSGEAYDDFGDCLAGLYVFRGRAAESPVNDRTLANTTDRIADTEFEVYRDEEGGYDWNFQQTTGEPIASGIAHPDKVRILAAIEEVKKHAGSAEVIVEAEEPVDIEMCAQQGHQTPRAKRYRIRIDRQRYVVDRPSITGRELLELANKTPFTRFRIDQKLQGGHVKRIGYDESVAVCAPGVERFMTIPLDQNEGAQEQGALAADIASNIGNELRREFDLPEEDIEHLDARGLTWETLRDGAQLWLLIHNWPLPEGYSVRTVTLALMIPPSYPVAQIDMAFFAPALVRADQATIGATTDSAMIRGTQFQRWSRHRTPENPWRPGLDGIVTHLALVEHWMEREFEKVPLRT